MPSQQATPNHNHQNVNDALLNNSRLKKLPILFDELGLSALTDEQLNNINKIDACLPQTQCGLCEHPEGCLPYAHAIVVKGEAHNKCVPGGQPVSDTIAKILDKPKLPAMPSKWQTDKHSARPQEVRAVIIEDDCIGCTKCIPACPVDAIIGTGKHMHTVLTDLCTGCELCIAPCPVDCIELVPIERSQTKEQRQQEQQHLRGRYHTHLDRVTAQMKDKRNTKPVVSVVESKLASNANAELNINEAQAKNAIAAAKLRTKIKKLQKQLAVRDNDKKQAELESLQEALAKLK